MASEELLNERFRAKIRDRNLGKVETRVYPANQFSSASAAFADRYQAKLDARVHAEKQAAERRAVEEAERKLVEAMEAEKRVQDAAPPPTGEPQSPTAAATQRQASTKR